MKGGQIVKHLTWFSGLVLAVMFLACCGQETAATPAEKQPEKAAAATATSAVESVGSVAFALDGQAKTFDYAPAGNNAYMKLASSIVAKPSTIAAEKLTISFISIDLKSVQYPADLPLARNLGAPLSPMSAMATVGFNYISEDGQEWSGPGKLHVEAFTHDGVIEGTFTDVSLPHTQSQRPNVVLTNGSYRVRIASAF